MSIKRYLFLLLAMMCMHTVFAQHIRVVAPRHVAEGEEFQVEYTVFTQDVRRFQLGGLSSGLEKVFGPATSSQSSIRIVDGHTSSTSSVSFTYVFVANKKGKASIGPAHIEVGGQDLASTPVRIQVLGSSNVARTSAGGSSYTDDYEDRPSSSSSSSISPKDLFIKVNANKTVVYEQEPVLLTYKVYTTKDLRKLLGQMPDLAGFHVQEVQLPQQKSFHKERLNGRTYNCVTWSEYVMYPQMTGNLKVPAITFKGLIHLGGDDFNPFEAFGIDDSRDVERNIIAPSLMIHVKPLPPHPADFSGGVGHFNISAQLNKKETHAGDPISIRVVVSGVGNLKLINQPSIVYPDGFESYDVKIADKTRLTTKGSEGNMIYDQTIIPHKEGKFTIAPIKFVYFDISQHKYITITTESLSVNVLKGKNGGSSVADNTPTLGNDIHPIKTSLSSLEFVHKNFFGSFLYWVIIAVLGAIIAGIAYYFRDGFKNSSVDFTLKREKNANKKASSRLDQAYTMMQRGDNIEFYEEISHALWGYVSDKLHIPVGELSRDNVSEKMVGLSISDELVQKIIGALDECEFERYAPGDERGNMKRTYNTAMEAISSIEDATRSVKKGRTMKTIFFAISLLTLMNISGPVMAQSKKDVDELYQKGNYTEAVKGYNKLLKKGVSAELYYNLGNAYYKQDSIASAIVSYERALRLAPSDNDIKYNLQFVQSKTIDNITPESEMFFVTWYKSLVNMLSINSWAWVSILSLLVIIGGMYTFLLVKRLRFRKALSKLLVFPIATFVLSILFAWQQYHFLSSSSYAIITSPSAVIRFTPDASANKTFILHEGTKIKITDNSLNDWCQFKVADGRTGWILRSQIENI